MAKTAAHASNNLTAEVRTKTGKGASRQARRDGKVAAVLYGHGADPQHLTIFPPANPRPCCVTSAPTRCSPWTSAARELLALPKAIEIDPIRRNIPARRPDHRPSRRARHRRDQRHRRRRRRGPDTLVNQESNTIEERVRRDVHPGEPDPVGRGHSGVGTQFPAGAIPLPEGVTLISEPDTLVVNVVAAPTAEDLEAEGAGEVTEDEAEGEAAEGEAAEGEGEAGEEAPAAESE